MAIFTPYYRCTIDMITDIKFKKLYAKYGKDVYAVHWMWHMMLTEATKQSGDFNQGAEKPHDELSLMVTFDIVTMTHGVEFINKVMDDFCSDDLKLISKDESGLMRITNWEKFQHASLSADRTAKYRERLKNEPLVTEILDMFNKLSGKNIRVATESYRQLVRGRLSEGFTKEDFKKVIIWKIQKWGDDKKMSLFIRPDTLFRPSHFDSYLNEIPKNNPLTTMDITYPITSDSANSPTQEALVFAVTDIYGRRRVITQAQFDQAEEGYFNKV